MTLLPGEEDFRFATIEEYYRDYFEERTTKRLDIGDGESLLVTMDKHHWPGLDRMLNEMGCSIENVLEGAREMEESIGMYAPDGKTFDFALIFAILMTS